MDTELQALIARLLVAPRSERIGLREAILAHGVAAIQPLRDSMGRDPDLGPSVASWLEVLARREGPAGKAAVASLLEIARERGETGRYAEEGLKRLGVAFRVSKAGSPARAVPRSAGTEWRGFQAHEFGRNAGTSWRSADGRESLAPILAIALRQAHPGFVSFGVERAPEIHFALAHRYKGGQPSGFTSSKLVVYAQGPGEAAHVVAGWYIEKGNGQGETGPMDDGQRWDWPLVVEALGRAPFQAALTRAMATHGLTFGEYVSGRFLPNLGWTAHLEDGVPVARDNSRIPIAHGWDEIVARLRSIPADQEIGLHIWRTWPAGDAIEGGQPFALRQIAPCLIDLAGLYLEALGPKA